MSILNLDGRKILTSDSNPGIIIDRDEEKEKIMYHCINPLMNNEISSPIYIYGGSGTGKTFVVKSILDSCIDSSRMKGLNHIWINGNDTRTEYVSLVMITKSLEKYLPVSMQGGIKDFIPLKGWDYGSILDVLYKIIEENGIELLIVIDEIDKIVNRSGDGLIYNLLDANNILKNGHIYLIAISNDSSLENRFSSGVRTRLINKIHFSNYGINHLFEILKVFAELSLKENSYEDSDLIEIAKFLGSSDPNARSAKMILYNISRISEKKLEISRLKHAYGETEKSMWIRDLETKSLHHKLVLLAILRTCEYHDRLTAKRARYKFSTIPTTGNVYARYGNACREYNIEQKSMSTFKNILKSLDKDGFINTNIQSFGRARGLTSVFEPTIPIDILKPMIINLLSIL